MKEELKPYVPIADSIAATFGPRCEVTIHDLTTPTSSVVYVAGHATGRQVGQSFDHLVKDVLLNKDFNNDQANNYLFTTPGGQLIKSSSVLLRKDSQVIGMLCINYDITLGQQFCQEMAAFCNVTPQAEPTQETDASADVHSIINNLISNIFAATDTTQMTRKKAVELVKFMDEKGIFLVKGAMDQVAARLGVSKVTVYSYLDEAKGKKS